MGRFNHAQNGFDAGELSPKLHARTDLELYKRGAKELRNFYVNPEGVAMKRPGSRHVADTYGSSGAEEGDYPSRLIPFVYSQSESYVIEINEDGYRWITQSGASGSSGSIGTGAFSAVPLFTAAELPYIQYVQSADTLYLIHPAHQPLMVVRTAASTFQLRPFNYSLVGATATTIGGLAVNEIDTMPLLPVNTTAVALYASGVSGSVTLSADAAFFNALHVGAFFTLTGATVGRLKVTAFTNSTTVTATVIGSNLSASGSGNKTLVWYESAWSDYRGWPRAACYYQDRFVFGGTTTEPDRLWFSAIGSYNVFAQPLTSPDQDDPFGKTLLSRRVNQIQWMQAQRVLVVGTLGSEWRIFPPAVQDEGLNKDNIDAVEQTSHGSVHQQAYSANGAALFAQQDNSTIREFLFNFESDAYEAENLSIGADHLTLQGAITGMAWHDRLSILFLISNGKLYGLTRDRSQKVRAWHQHVMGGSFSTGDPVVFSLCVVPVGGESGVVDELWLCVKRTINSVTRYEIEAIRFNRDPEDDVYLDAHTYEDTDGSTINELDHLEGQTVGVVTDGYVSAATAAVSSGAVTTQDSFSDAYAGLTYTARLKALRPDPPSPIGSSQGGILSLKRAVIRFYKSQYAKVGPLAAGTELVPFEATTMDTAPEFYSGDKKVDLPFTPDIDSPFYIVSDAPLATHVCGFFLSGQVSDA